MLYLLKPGLKQKKTGYLFLRVLHLKQKHRFDGADALHVIVELHREGLLTPGARRALGDYVSGIRDVPGKKDSA